MKKQRLISNYVPRHLRLGLCIVPHDIENMQDVVEEIPVVDASGRVIYSTTVVKSVPAADAMAKYKVSHFDLQAMVKNGVPLKVINVNHSNAATIDQLESICKKIDGAEAFVNRVLAERQEREDWFHAFDEDSEKNSELNEIY